MKQNVLKIEHIYYSYHTLKGEVPVIKDITFTINTGEFLSLVGPSGCGKTTILNLLTGLLEPEKGEIIGAFKENFDSSFGYMLQQDQLFEWLSIWDNICLGPKIRHTLDAKTKEQAYVLMQKYGLEEFKDKKPSHLSGGMRQRVALIRTLVLQPKILFLDEPFSALDYQNRLKAANDIGQIIKKEKKTAILVTHDIGEAISLSSKVIVLTQRPTTIKKTFQIPYFNSSLTPLEIRNQSNFANYFNDIWRELNGIDS